MDLVAFLTDQHRSNMGLTLQILGATTSDLTEDELNWQANPGHHSIWHHVWHMFLGFDYHFANAMQVRPVWEGGGWQDRLDLTPMARVFDYPGNAYGGPVPRFVISDVPDSLVDELKAPSLPDYLKYVGEMLTKTTAVLEQSTVEQLTRPVDLFGGQIPAHAVATDFGHIWRHIGNIEDVRNLIRGPGQVS